MSVFGPSPKVPAKWPSMLSIASSDGGGSQGCLSPSVGRPGALNIFRAAEAGDLSVILSYLSGGGNANKAGKEGYTILHLAAMRNQAAMVKLLLDRGADPDVHDNKEGLTPLMWAAQLGHTAVLTLLLERGADSEQEDREDLTALHWAARMGKERALVVLLEHGSDVEAVDYDGNTPLIWAAREGHRECVNTLLYSGAVTTTPDENGNTALHFACQLGHAEIVSDLLDWGALATAQDYWQFTPFHRACSQGHGDVLVELLRARPRNLSKSGRVYPLGEDVDGGISSRGREREGSLSDAFGSGMKGGGIGGGIGVGGDVSPPRRRRPTGRSSHTIDLRNHFNATPLHRAAAKGHAEVVSMLLENGADVNARDGFFYTPLHLACVNGAAACVEALLEAGADPTPKAQGGVTPLLAARKQGVRELIEAALQTSHSMDVCISSEGSDTEFNSDEGSLRGSRILKRKSKSLRRSSAGDGSDRGDGRAAMDEGVDEEACGAVVAAAGAATPDRTTGCNSAAEQQRDETMALKGSVDVRTLPMTESKVTTVTTGEGGGGSALDAAVLPEKDARSDKGNDNDMDVDDGYDNEDVGEMVSRCREALVSSSPVAKTRGRRLIARGRPVSRLPKEDVNEKEQERGRERGRERTRIGEDPLFRRSNSGSILEKIFNGSSRRGDDSGSSGGGGKSDADSSAATASAAPSLPGKIVIPVPPERLLHTAPKIAPPPLPLPPQQVDAVETEAESDHLPPLPRKARAFSSPLPPHKGDETTSVASGESGDGGESQLLWTASDPREGSITAAFIAASKSLNFPLSTSASGNGNSQRRRFSAYASESVTAAAAVATAKLNRTASSSAAPAPDGEMEGGEQHPRKRAYRKRRAKSLPPSWDNGNSSGSGSGSGYRRKGKHPRRARLESRPCMKGPTAVIETLALDEDADNDDAALGCWLRGALAGTEEGAGSMTAAAAAAAAGAVAAAAVTTRDGEELEGNESSWFRFDDRRSFS